MHCDCNCFINMDKGMRALGHTLTAAGYGAVDLPAGAVRDVLTRPCAAADGAGPSPAAAAAAGMEAAERRSAEDGAGGGAEGREFVSWTELPRYVQMAIHKQVRACGLFPDGCRRCVVQSKSGTSQPTAHCYRTPPPSIWWRMRCEVGLFFVGTGHTTPAPQAWYCIWPPAYRPLCM